LVEPEGDSMGWVVGIDEAGYGPNLGPLIQAAVALHLPDDDPAGWETLKPVVRRAHEKDDGRLLIDDSKKVYTRGGLEALEAVGYGLFGVVPQQFEQFLSFALPEVVADLRQEGWFDPTEQLPVETTPAALMETVGRWTQEYRPGLYGLLVNLVPAPLFNKVCDGSGSKATVLSCGLVSLLAGWRRYVGNVPYEEFANKPITFLCDKQGGRNYYAALVQQAFPDGWVVAERESADESRYRVERLERPVTVTFRPRADAESVAVSLASMLAKYLREVCMRQFNRFWATHVPGIAPTAGYPSDAKRFYAQIRAAMEKLGLSEDQVWRKR
jgi:ribonuclease HII